MISEGKIIKKIELYRSRKNILWKENWGSTMTNQNSRNGVVGSFSHARKMPGTQYTL